MTKVCACVCVVQQLLVQPPHLTPDFPSVAPFGVSATARAQLVSKHWQVDSRIGGRLGVCSLLFEVAGEDRLPQNSSPVRTESDFSLSI